MLKLKYLRENFALAELCLDLYVHDEDSADYMKGNYHISSSAVYPFKQDGQVCYMRIVPVEEMRPSKMISIVETILWLRENAFHAMKPVLTMGGKRVDVVETEWGDYVVSAFYRVRGKAIKNNPFSAELYEGYGETLGKLHKTWSSIPSQDNILNTADKIDSIRKNLTRNNAPKYMLKELDDVESELKKIEITKENYGLIHYCFSVSNVFYDEKEERYNVIDFDDMFYSFYVMDVERSLISISKLLDKKKYRIAREAFLSGYQKQYHLYDKEEALLPLMKRFINLDKYSNMKYVLSEGVANPSDNIIYQKDELLRRSKKIEDQVLNAR